MYIFAVADENLRGGHMLCFLDDGEGMLPGSYHGCLETNYNLKMFLFIRTSVLFTTVQIVMLSVGVCSFSLCNV